MAFISIIDSDEAFLWRPTDPNTGDPYESEFELRIVADAAIKELRKAHTKQVFDKDLRKMVDKLDDLAYVAAVLDYAIVGWSGIKSARTKDDLPCTAEMKARLPEKWKAEVFRLCAAKEAGDVVGADAEKKSSAPISTGNATNSNGSPAA